MLLCKYVTASIEQDERACLAAAPVRTTDGGSFLLRIKVRWKVHHRG